MSSILEKLCTRCRIVKPVTEFGAAKNAKDGLRYHCKDCRKLYRRELRERGVVKPGAEERFWSRVEKTETCWLWRGGITTEGYGRFFHAGKDVPSHHMPMIFRGETPPKYPMVCDHICKVRNCVRPDHIRVVTQGVNTLENSNSSFAKNKAKTHCKYGHPLSGANLAIHPVRRNKRDPSKVYYGRVCLTCYPGYRKWAVVPNNSVSGVATSIPETEGNR